MALPTHEDSSVVSVGLSSASFTHDCSGKASQGTGEKVLVDQWFMVAIVVLKTCG